MAVSADIYNALVTDPVLTALVPVANIFMQRRTNEVPFPSLHLSQDAGNAFPVLEGEVDQQQPIYVSEILATTYDAAYDIENAVRDALVNTRHATFVATRGEMSSHLFNEDTKVHELIGAWSVFYMGAN